MRHLLVIALVIALAGCGTAVRKPARQPLFRRGACRTVVQAQRIEETFDSIGGTFEIGRAHDVGLVQVR